MKRRTVPVYDVPSGMGGSFTAELVEELPRDRVKVRVWYGRASADGWVPWPEWDGFRMEVGRDELSNPHTLQLFKEPT